MIFTINALHKTGSKGTVWLIASIWFCTIRILAFAASKFSVCHFLLPDSHVLYGIAADCWLFLTPALGWNLAGACEEVASDLGLGGGFRWVLRFSPPVTIG